MKPEELIEFAEEIARVAGKILMQGFRSGSTVISQKSRTNLVTSMDIASEKFLVEKISERFIDHAIVAEEGSGRDSSGEYLWYVDPLDGTNNFAHGIQNFAVSLGIYSKKQNKVMAGVVYDPYHEELFKAVRGMGAFLNDKKIKVSDTDDIGSSIIATGFPYEKQNPDKNNSIELKRILPFIRDIRRLGAASLDLCYIACGRMDGYWESTLHPWDTAGASIVLEEAGGRITHYHGEVFHPERDDVVASNGKIHEDIIRLING